MTITNSDAQKLYSAGFTVREIQEIANATDPKGEPQPPIVLDNEAWQKTMQLRFNFNTRLRQDFMRTHKRDLTRMEYDNIVNRWYQGGVKKTPFDWLVDAYGKGNKPKSDFIIARQHFARQQRVILKRAFMTK